jgi:hypothetical protein
MRVALAKLLVLTNAVLLALPIGWCCVVNVRQASAAPEVPVVHSCCGNDAGQPASSDSPQSPISRECCCQTDWTPSSAEPRILPPAAPAIDMVLIELETDISEAFLAPFTLSAPPFRILHCVWRC